MGDKGEAGDQITKEAAGGRPLFLCLNANVVETRGGGTRTNRIWEIHKVRLFFWGGWSRR